MKLENLIGFSESILESPKIVIFNLTFRVSKIGIFQIFQLFLAFQYSNFHIRFSDLKIYNFLYPKIEVKNRTFLTFLSRRKCQIFNLIFRVSKIENSQN